MSYTVVNFRGKPRTQGHSLAATITLLYCILLTSSPAVAKPRELLFGDTHLHTSYSFDAYLYRNQTGDPDMAYRWAKGMPVIHPFHRARVQIGEPLDFLVVSDHAEVMGVFKAMHQGQASWEDLGWWGNLKRWIAVTLANWSIDREDGAKFFAGLLAKPAVNPGTDPVQDPANAPSEGILGDTSAMEKSAWHAIVDAAERHYQPGLFTTFIGWEWSSIPTGANLHRVVISPDGGNTAHQYLPFGWDQNQYPQALWEWLDETQQRTGARFIAVPHNSSISKGYMYDDTALDGKAITAAYARQRMRWEPVSEITQIKGDSETHPALSPADEFADFETYPWYIQQGHTPYVVAPGDYARSALKRGLALAQQTGVNPYQFGLIGSSDSHSGLAAVEEDNFWGKFASDSTPERKRGEDNISGRTVTGWNMYAAGLAAGWSPGHPRDEIFAAFQRREVYATTGSRIQVQVFAGWAFDQSALDSPDFATIGYEQGVPMGGLLPPAPGEHHAPRFMIRAARGQNNATLDRIQVIKGWLDADGQQQEKIFNVAWSGDRSLDSTGALPAVGNSVNLATALYDNSIGATSLATLWTDPDFDPTQLAFYYVRVLEIPTPRHSLYDAVALQTEIPEEGPATIQERAYTSPIWYRP